MLNRPFPSNQKKTPVSAKLLLMSAVLILVLSTIIGGTVAWLVTKTEPVKNTFIYGDINITLSETPTNKDGDNDPNTNQYPMVPGAVITKDPKVTVLEDSENAWLFVKLEKTENFDTFLEYEMAAGWQQLTVNDVPVPGVYYRQVDQSDAPQEYWVIKDNTVNVKADVSKEMLNALDTNEDGTAKVTAEYPVMTVTAYAVQRDSNISTASVAWALIGNN